MTGGDADGAPGSVTAVLRARAYRAGVLIGIAVMAAVDEIVFHQILGWHHFYDAATPDIALVSDGLLHAAELFVLIGGFVLMLDARRRSSFRRGVAWAGVFVGLGLFQLWDGIVDHKLLRLHQVRYGVDLLPYDLLWNAAGAALLLTGIVLSVIAGRARAPRDRDPGVGPTRDDGGALP